MKQASFSVCWKVASLCGAEHSFAVIERNICSWRCSKRKREIPHPIDPSYIVQLLPMTQIIFNSHCSFHFNLTFPSNTITSNDSQSHCIHNVRNNSLQQNVEQASSTPSDSIRVISYSYEIPSATSFLKEILIPVAHLIWKRFNMPLLQVLFQPSA